METTYSLNADLFVIPYEEKGADSHIAYFPLQSLVFEINGDAAEILGSLRKAPLVTGNSNIKRFLDDLVNLRLINNKQEPKPFAPYKDQPAPTFTLLLLTDVCQLKCLYCYGDAKKNGLMMPLHIAKKAIDTVTKNAIEQKTGKINIGFHGGGEPTLNWSVLRASYDYALEKCKENNFQLHTSLCTNGIISRDKAKWIIDNVQDLAISMDGTPEMQNKQRPMQNGKGSFENVASTIDLFNKYKKVYSIRLTATEFSQGRLYEIIKFIMDRFTPPMICIEPLYICGRCETSGCKPPLLDDFIKEMLTIYQLGRERNIPIQYSGNRIANLMSRFCGAQGSNFFITPKGFVTACLEVIELDNPKADFLIYGRYDPETDEFIFDKEKYKRLAGSQVHSFESCNDCFAKWHCAGDCIAKAPDLINVTRVRNEYRCKLNKTLLRQSLIETMNNQIGIYGSETLAEPGVVIPQN